jgi:hypothetical protein
MEERSADSADGKRRRCSVAVLEVRGSRIALITRHGERENCVVFDGESEGQADTHHSGPQPALEFFLALRDYSSWPCILP